MEQTAQDESKVVVMARRGDADAFAQLVQRYQTPVYNLAYRTLGDAAEAEDAAQETFLRAYQRLRTYNPERPFAPWLMSIATHYCIDRLRRRRFQGPSLDDDAWMGQIQADDPAPDEVAIQNERAADAQQLLDALPPDYRMVVVLKYWNDLSVEEIARVTGDSVSSVKVKLHRARQRMAQISRSQESIRSSRESEMSHAR